MDDEFFLPGLPIADIRAAYLTAPGNEIESGKFSSPESSAALVANAFGLFLNSPGGLEWKQMRSAALLAIVLCRKKAGEFN